MIFYLGKITMNKVYKEIPWYFKDEIVERESEYIESGGSLLFPMPYPHLVTAGGEITL